MLTELQARALSHEELADRLIDHDDPCVQILARGCFDKEVDAYEIERLESKLEDAQQEAGDAEDKCNELRDLLRRVIDECEVPADLSDEIKAELL